MAEESSAACSIDIPNCTIGIVTNERCHSRKYVRERKVIDFETLDATVKNVIMSRVKRSYKGNYRHNN